jgi:plastocyanin
VATGSTLQIQAGDSFFAPTCQTGVPAGTVTLTVHNGGQQLHNVSVPGQGIDTDVTPGQTITVKVKLGGKALPYFCKYHRTSGMWGSLLPQG